GRPRGSRDLPFGAAEYSNAESSRGHLAAGDARPDLGKGGVPGGRGVVAEGRKPAVVRGSQARRVDELRRLEHAIADLLGGLDARIDRIDDADEDPAIAPGVLAEDPEHAGTILLARELDVEVRDAQPEEARQQLGIVHVGAVRGVPISSGARVDSQPSSLLVAESREHAVVQV